MRNFNGFGNLLGFISISVFLATEIASFAAARVWSVSGMLHLGVTMTWLLAAAVAAPSLYAIAKVSILAYQAQTDPQNH